MTTFLLPPVTMAQLMTLWGALNTFEVNCGDDAVGLQMAADYKRHRDDLLKLLAPIVGEATQCAPQR